ncbi:MAG: hypothetical protein EBU59_11450 [Planctomycetia bacterium]|nr:hypothetical protein [Planctomycetia bacterium]
MLAAGGLLASIAMLVWLGGQTAAKHKELADALEGNKRNGSRAPLSEGAAGVAAINLVIHHGQHGVAVDEAKEENPGAFTVANLNDTNSNGALDNSENNGNGVAGEKDLMKLVIHPPAPNLGGEVELTIAGSAEIWKDSEKKTVEKKRSFKASQLPLTRWVEVTAKSEEIRAVRITATYNDLSDTVVATGVWGEIQATLHDRDQAIWPDIGAETLRMVNLRGGKAGLAGPDVKHLKNVILFKFVIFPKGIGGGDTSFIKFDNARQMQLLKWRIKASGKKVVDENIPFPPGDELVNDDKSQAGETNVPDADGQLFAHDAPGLRSWRASPAEDQLFYRYNFLDFTRVRFDDVQPQGGEKDDPKVDGSRCTPKVKWTLAHSLKKVEQRWTRTTGDDTESSLNFIKLGHSKIPANPPF